MKITIKNETCWNTSDLRRLYRAALRAAGAKPSVRAVLVVKNSRCSRASWGLGIRGRCYYGKHSQPGACLILLPLTGDKNWLETTKTEELRDQVARVMHHEALHGVGARHKDMTEEQLHAKQPVPWAAELPLQVQEKKPVDRAAAFEDKLDHARSMLRKAATREKRASTIHAKWRRRVRMLERKTP